MPKLSSHLHDLMSHQHVLLLQGKMGTFFSRFARFLTNQGVSVSKVNFNAGDAHFYTAQPAYPYTGTVHDFDMWLADLVEKQHIDAVVCFGDCRDYHQVAKQFSLDKSIDFYVFEEGYLRPDYITFEKHGINGYSQFDASDVDDFIYVDDTPLQTNNKFARMMWAAIVYYIVCYLNQSQFPHYAHYRGMTAWQEFGSWLKVLYYKVRDKTTEKKLQNYLTNTLHKQYFLVTLQVHNDSQITAHSHYDDVSQFIIEVIESFAAHSDSSHALLLKHHPLDRGHRNYSRLIKQLAKKHGISARVFYGCDMHLPSLMKASLGVITINSTTGLQALYHKIPTISLGKAVYNLPRLTAQCGLDDFWLSRPEPDHDYYLKFRQKLVSSCQLNGSFYGSSPWMHPYERDNATYSDKINTQQTDETKA